MKTIKAFWHETAAATSIEYAMIAFFASIALVAGATTIGRTLNSKMLPIANNLN